MRVRDRGLCHPKPIAESLNDESSTDSANGALGRSDNFHSTVDLSSIRYGDQKP